MHAGNGNPVMSEQLYKPTSQRQRLGYLLANKGVDTKFELGPDAEALAASYARYPA